MPQPDHSQEEEEANIETALALRADKSEAGKKVVAACVAKHCEAHDDVMEYQATTLASALLSNCISYSHSYLAHPTLTTSSYL